jgi:CRISPR-associated protein Csb2
MSETFVLSVRFLYSVFHGSRDGGGWEWPPSPLRVFQALVAAAAGFSRRGQLPVAESAALDWLETQEAPSIVAPRTHIGSSFRIAVPNNDLDVIAAAWAKGLEARKQPNELKTLKTVRRIWLLDGGAVQYLWRLPRPLPEDAVAHLSTLTDIASCLVAVGWGIDVVTGHGSVLAEHEAERLVGERWCPHSAGSRGGLRVPTRGTLADLCNRHRCFLRRLDRGVFTAPPPLSVFDTVEYRRAADAARRPVAAFALAKLDSSGYRPFDTARRALTVAGMARHATKLRATRAGRSEAWINTFVLGHGETTGDLHLPVGAQRFAYLPLPSLEARGQGKSTVVGSIRRIVVTAFGEGCDSDVAWARRALAGQELISEGATRTAALLSAISADDAMVRRYVAAAPCWATVTPVVLPGFDDPAHYRRRLKKGVTSEEQKRLLLALDERVESLLRKAILQAGFSSVLAANAHLEWRTTGFLAGVGLASAYGVPDHLRRYPRLHVKILWRDATGAPIPVAGPICIGGGRYCGVGLFVRFPRTDE